MIKPLGDRIVLQAIEKEEKTASGIVLPDTAKEKPQEGQSDRCGLRPLGKWTESRTGSKKGDRVIFSKYAGTEVKVGDKEYLILRESDILAISTVILLIPLTNNPT